jgi:tetratricopeptide (TPR) repeat protein
MSCLSPRRASIFVGLLVGVWTAPALAQEAGLDDLSEATRLKISASSLDDLNAVIQKVDSALEKGLEAESASYAKQMLASTLLQRASTYAAAAAQDRRGGTAVAMQLRQRATNDLQRIIDLDKKAWDAHLLMGRLHAMPLGDADAARRAFTAVADSEEAPAEKKADALALRSAVQREPERRMADLNRAIELQPEKPDYYRLRSEVKYGRDNFDEALADIDKALKADDEHVQSHELRGMILLGMKRYDDALAAFNRATELEPQSTSPFQRRSQLFLQKGDPKEAIVQLTKALEVAPRDIQTLLLRASVYFQMKEMDKALADVDEAIRIEPRIPQSHLLRADLYAANGQVDQAIAVLEQLAQMLPGQPSILNQLGNLYINDGKPAKAVEVLTQALRVESDNLMSLQLRGNAYLNIGEHADAINDFRKAEALEDEDDDNLLNNFAWVLATSPFSELRDGKRAVELATRAADMSAYEVPHILSTLAAAYAEIGDFETALKWSKKAVEVSQKSIDEAETEKLKERLRKEHEQLTKEVASYEQKKPWRERQMPDGTSDARPDGGKSGEPADKAVSERKRDF